MPETIRHPATSPPEKMPMDAVLDEAATTIETLAVAKHTGQISIIVEMFNGSVVRAKIAQEKIILKHRKQ